MGSIKVKKKKFISGLHARLSKGVKLKLKIDV